MNFVVGSSTIANITATGLGIGMTPTRVLDITQSQNAASIGRIFNGTSGTAGSAEWRASNDVNDSIRLISLNQSYTTSGLFAARKSVIASDGVGLAITTMSAQAMQFGINNAEVARFGSDGSFLVGSTTSAGAGKARIENGLGIGMTPSNVLDITQSQNNESRISILNSNGGASAAAELQATNGTHAGVLYQFGTGYTTSGILRQDGTVLSSGSSAGGLTLATFSSSPIYFGVGLAEVARFDTSGRLQIGTTAGTGRINMANSGGGLHQINSAGVDKEILNLFSDDNLYFSAPSNIIIRPGGGGEAARFTASGNLQITDANYYLTVTASTPYLNFDTNDYLSYTRSTNTMNFTIGSSTIANITATGLGIGTTPACTLNVYGANTASRGQLSIDSSGTDSRLTWYTSGTFRAALSVNATAISFDPQNNQSYIFPGTGVIIAGRTTAVTPSGTTIRGCFASGVSATNGTNSVCMGSNTITFDDNFLFINNAAGTGVYLPNGSTAWVANSARELKENIEALNAHDILRAVGDEAAKNGEGIAVLYDLKNNDRREAGSIAQNWLVALPAIVEASNSEKLGLMYDRMGAIAAQGVYEQLAINATLEARLTALENK